MLQKRICQGIFIFAVFDGMLAAGNRALLINRALAVLLQMTALAINQEMPSGMIPESLYMVMGYLPNQAVKVNDCARRRNFNRNIITAEMITILTFVTCHSDYPQFI